MVEKVVCPPRETLTLRLQIQVSEILRPRCQGRGGILWVSLDLLGSTKDETHNLLPTTYLLPNTYQLLPIIYYLSSLTYHHHLLLTAE